MNADDMRWPKDERGNSKSWKLLTAEEKKAILKASVGRTAESKPNPAKEG